MTNLIPTSLRLVHPDWAARVPAPAHDSLTAVQRRRYIEENPDSYLLVTRAPEDVADGQDWDVARAVAASRGSLARLLERGAFREPGPAAFYLYRLSNSAHTQVGIVCGVDVDDYDQGRVKIHEQIREARSEHLATHLEGLRVQSSPIALAHRPNETIADLIASRMAARPPDVDFTASDGLHQQVWTIDDESGIEAIRGELAGVDLYLIDGHHRAAAASAHRKRSQHGGAESMLCAVFSSTDIRNEAFHRCLLAVDPDAHLEQLQSTFAVREAPTVDAVLARGADELALRMQGRWLLVTVPGGGADHSPTTLLKNLDPVRLQEQILGPFLSIDSSSPSSTLLYRHGMADRADLEVLSSAVEPAVWVMRPVPITTLMAASDAGLIMPPKSTYFLPKVRSGVFLRSLD